MATNSKSLALIFGGLFAVVVIACAIYVLVNPKRNYGSEFEEFSKNENQTKMENMVIGFDATGVIDAPLSCEKGMRYDVTSKSCRKSV
jgi:hypothetical protein